MGTVTLKSRVGSLEFRRRTLINEEGRLPRYEMRTYRFGFENDFRCSVPKTVWEDLRGEWLDRTTGLRYQEAFLEL